MLLLGLVWGVGLHLLGSCAPSANNFLPTETIRIGIIDSLTGDDAESGRAIVDAATLATQEANDQGGLEVRGQKRLVELVIRDAQSKPEVAASAAQSLITQENIVAIVGPNYSRYAIPVANLAEQAQIPMISPRSTNPETTAGKRYVFRANFIDTLQGQVIARFAHSDLKAKTAAVLYDIASPYNRGIAEVFEQAFGQQGGTIVASEAYTTGEQDFTAPLQQIRNYQPDVLFLPNYENEVPTQAAQARQLGIQSTLLGADAWGGIKESDRQPLEGAYFSDHFLPGTVNEATRTFIGNYQQAYGYEPGTNAAATYDSMGLLFSVIQQQGTTDAEAIRQGLANYGPYHGVTGILDYQGTGDPIVSVTILQIKNGKPTFYKEIKPSSLILSSSPSSLIPSSSPLSFILHPLAFLLHPSSLIPHPSSLIPSSSPLSFILHPSSFILHPSSLIPHPFFFPFLFSLSPSSLAPERAYETPLSLLSTNSIVCSVGIGLHLVHHAGGLYTAVGVAEIGSSRNSHWHHRFANGRSSGWRQGHDTRGRVGGSGGESSGGTGSRSATIHHYFKNRR
jgi:branched-chain amino acid transport system substrate-binding protein